MVLAHPVQDQQQDEEKSEEVGEFKDVVTVEGPYVENHNQFPRQRVRGWGQFFVKPALAKLPSFVWIVKKFIFFAVEDSIADVCDIDD